MVVGMRKNGSDRNGGRSVRRVNVVNTTWLLRRIGNKRSTTVGSTVNGGVVANHREQGEEEPKTKRGTKKR